MDQRDIDVLIEKNLQARRAVSRNIWKFSIPDLSRIEKTKVSIVIIASGLSKDQKKPKIELRYLSLNSFIVKFLTSSLYSNNHYTPDLPSDGQLFVWPKAMAHL